jgi:anti-sigma factor RsiW
VSGCDVFRPLLDERLDGDLAADRAAALEAHLAECADCRAVAEGLAAVRAGLRALPEHPLPSVALEEVLDRTVRAGRPKVLPRFAALWPAWAGAAVVVVLALLLARLPHEPSTLAQPSPAEVARARSEARLVLSVASNALHRAERAARDRVVAGEVAPALRRLPIRWTARPEPRKS